MLHLDVIYLYLDIAVLLLILPNLLRYLKVPSNIVIWAKTIIEMPDTLIHEISHAVVAILTLGKVKKINLNSDKSGTTHYYSRNSISSIVTAYAGYTGSSLATVLLYYLLYNQKYSMVLYGFLILTLISALLWIRNLYGFLWTIIFSGILFIIIYYHNESFILHSSVLLSSIVWVQSIAAAYTILKLSFKNKEDAGDATSLAKHTFIPALIWGLIFFAQSVITTFYIFKEYIIGVTL